MVELTRDHMKIVNNVMARCFPSFAGREMWEDVRGAGLLGLTKAAHDFDPARGGAFGSYAWWRIKGEIRDYLRSEDHLTRSERRKVQAGLMEDPGMPGWLDMQKYAECAADPADEYAALCDADAIQATVINLPPREFYSVWQHDIEGETLAHIGSVLDVSESRVSQLRKAGHDRLRVMLAPAVMDAA